MTGEYVVENDGTMYSIFKDGMQVLTPAGKPFDTVHAELAKLVCEDMKVFGPDPRGVKLSYVGLQAGYCDYGRSVKKDELAANALITYNPEIDIALVALNEYENLINDLPSRFAGVTYVIDPLMYFGPAEKDFTIMLWLRSLSRRELLAVQTIGGNYQTILCGYRLLSGEPELPIKNVVTGLVHYGIRLGFYSYKSKKFDKLINEIEEFFLKAKNFASFADD